MYLQHFHQIKAFPRNNYRNKFNNLKLILMVGLILLFKFQPDVAGKYFISLTTTGSSSTSAGI